MIKEYKYIDIGRIRVYFISDRSFSVDGSILYTPLSREEWSKFANDIGEGKVEVKTRSIVIKTRHHLILVDCGLGNKLKMPVHETTRESDLIKNIEDLGFKPSDIDAVILTHLHYDHAGFALDENGRPAFNNATYYIQKQEWDDANNPDEITALSYIPELFTGLKNSKHLKLINGDYLVTLGVRLWLSDGHTSGHQMVLVKSRGEGLFFCGDIIPTGHHIRPDLYSAYDYFPLSVLSMKKRVLKIAGKHNWYLAFSHDPDEPYIKF
jgi:glyoxylase-like metal-dependent hydrolase (beta-lactamase superfamily II)